MALTIQGLQQQISELKREERKLRKEYEKRIRQLENETRIRMNSLRRSLEQSYEERNARQAAEYQRALDQLRRELERERLKNLRELEEQLRTNVEQRYQQLKEELEALLRRIEEDADARLTALEGREADKARLAREHLDQAQVQLQHTSERAHQQFFPGRLQILANSLDKAREMMNQEQYEASCATSVMLKVRLLELEGAIEDRLGRWLLSFQSLSSELASVEERITAALTTREGVLSEDAASELLEHRYNDVFSHTDRCRSVLECVEEQRERLGAEEIDTQVAERYILSEDWESERELDELRRTLKYELPRRITQMARELASLLQCSDQRREWAKAIAEHMRRRHNTGEPVCNDFQGPPPAPDSANQGGWLLFHQPLPDERYREISFLLLPVLHGEESSNHIRIAFPGPYPNPRFKSNYMSSYIPELLRALDRQELWVGLYSDPGTMDGSTDQNYSLQSDPKTGRQVLVTRSAGTAAGMEASGSAAAPVPQPSEPSPGRPQPRPRRPVTNPAD